MKTIFNTQDCYEGKSISEDSYVIGNQSELYQSEDIKNDTISWSDMAYEDEKNYFMEFLDSLIKAYEKRYRTTVEYVGLVGRVGLWNGSPVGGKIIKAGQNPIEHMGNVDEIDVTVDEDGIIRINGHHHDGTHRMCLYLLTENKLRKVAPDYLRYGDCGYQEMENIYEQLKPLRYGKASYGYYGSLAA